MTYHDRPNPGWAGVAMGLMIIAVGVILLFDQAGLMGWRPGWNLWPLLLIGFGLARFVQPRQDGTREGGWFMFIGAWLLLNEMHVLRFRESWPLFLVAIGVQTMWKAVRRPTPPSASQPGQGS